MYDSTKNKTDYLLRKGDQIEILETEKDWVKIKFLGESIMEGWLRITDVNL